MTWSIRSLHNRISSDQSETEQLVFWSLMTLFIFTALWAMIFVPMNNDEANHYHLLNCFYYPFSHVNDKLEQCGHENDLITFFNFHFTRSNPYTGITPSLLYFPFYFLFHTAEVLYGFGLIFFLAFSILISRLTSKPFLTFAFVLAFFPFCFNFIHDTGPIKFSFLIFPLGVILLRRVAETKELNSYLYALILAFLVFMAFEEKLFFIYLLPGYCFFLLAFVGNTFQEVFYFLRKLWKPLSFCCLVFIGLALTLLFATKGDGGFFTGSYYINLIQLMEDGVFKVMPGYPIQFIPMSQKWFRFLLFWPHYGARYFDLSLVDAGGFVPKVTISPSTFVLLCLLPSLLCILSLFGLLDLYRNKKLTGLSSRTVFLILSCLSIVVTFTFLGKVWAGHHFVFIWLPLFVLFCDLIGKLSPRFLVGITVVFLAANISTVLWLTQASFISEVSPDRKAISAFFDDNRSSQSIISYLSWGYDYIHAGYGPTNQIIADDPLATHGGVVALFDMARVTKRKIYFVCRLPDPSNMIESLYEDTCHKELLENAIACILKKNMHVEEVLPGLTTWHVFSVDPAISEPADLSQRNCAFHGLRMNVRQETDRLP